MAETIVQASACSPVAAKGSCAPATYRVFTFTTGLSTLQDLTVQHGRCAGACSQTGAAGGGIYNSSRLILKNTLIQFNDASSNGGGVYSRGVSLVVNNSEIHNNSAASAGGGVWSNDDLLTIANGSLFDSNENGASGGGLFAQGVAGSISHSTFANNSGGEGAAFYSSITGQLDIEYSTFSNNISDDFGGGVYLNYGLYNIKDSAIINNRTSEQGGGLIIDSTAFEANISNTTISGNISDSPDAAAGGLTAYDATVNLYNVTITNNSGGFAGGISDWEQATSVFNIRNSVIYGNLGTTSNDCDVQSGSMDFDGKPNILGDSTGCTPLNTGMVIAADPQLAPLANNGGPTQTHALQAGSPAIGSGDNSLCADVSTVNNLDQRDVARPFGSHCDLGAFEFNTDFMSKDGFETPPHLILPVSLDGSVTHRFIPEDENPPTVYGDIDVTAIAFTVDLGELDTISVSLSVPVGQEIFVNLPPGQTGRLTFSLNYHGELAEFPNPENWPTTFQLTGLEGGGTVTQTGAQAFGRINGNQVNYQYNYIFTEWLTFTGLELESTGPFTSGGSMTYNAVNPVFSVQYSDGSLLADPGQFVFIQAITP